MSDWIRLASSWSFKWVSKFSVPDCFGLWFNMFYDIPSNNMTSCVFWSTLRQRMELGASQPIGAEVSALWALGAARPGRFETLKPWNPWTKTKKTSKTTEKTPQSQRQHLIVATLGPFGRWSWEFRFFLQGTALSGHSSKAFVMRPKTKQLYFFYALFMT